MKYNKLLILLLIPLFFSIVKADGCGLTCPKGSHNHMEFALILVCNLFTWSFCHIFSFFASVIIVVIIFVFWYIQPSERKKKVKYLLYALTGIVIFILFYPYIRAFTQTTPSVPTTTIPTDTCENFDTSTCILSDTGESYAHIPYVTTNHWKITCPFMGVAQLSVTGNATVIGGNDININTAYVYEDVSVTDFNGSEYTITISQCTS